MERSFGIIACSSLFALLGCSSNAQARQCPENPANAAASNAPHEAFAAETRTVQSSDASAAAAPGDNAKLTASNAGNGTVPNAGNGTVANSGTVAVPNATNPSPEPAESLPELKMKITGMHIGGGPNDAETKRPFLSAIEAGFDRMRVCYQKAEEPTKGGTFGVDLRVERDGGHPKLQAVRTAMKGDAMRTCLEQAFLGLDFGKPAKGATVLSASVYFELSP